MRNLNGYEIGGRTLRVDNACTEKSRMEMAALLSGPQVENPYGEPCDPDAAPEIISKTVASLPPEQMYELMKQMKECIQNNPHEARTMLLQNPQLAYALLQAQVVMRILDPAQAVVSFSFGHQSLSVSYSICILDILVQAESDATSANSTNDIPRHPLNDEPNLDCDGSTADEHAVWIWTRHRSSCGRPSSRGSATWPANVW